jgi:GMP synthase-like glutamine amidotransferase
VTHRILVLRHDTDSGLGSLEAPLRDAGLAIEVWESHVTAAPSLPTTGYHGVIVLGGIVNPDQDDEHAWLASERTTIEQALAAGIPTLGVCLGGQLLAQAAGGSAQASPHAEIGWFEIEATPALAEDELFSGFPERFTSFEWHYYCFDPPPGATLLARGGAFNQAFRVGDRAWGTQFHIEVEAPSVHEWLGIASEDVVAHGFHPEEIARRTVEVDAEHVALAHGLSARFAEVVARYATER